MMPTINYEQVLKLPDLPGVITSLIKQIQNKGGTTVGTWLKNTSTLDLVAIQFAIREFHKLKNSSEVDFRPNAQETREYPYTPKSVIATLPLLVDILSCAEGLEIASSSDSIFSRAILLEEFISIEILRRRGLKVEILYSNMTLNDDIDSESATKPIFKFEKECKDQVLKALSSNLKQPNAMFVFKSKESDEGGSSIQKTPWTNRVARWFISIGYWIEGFKKAPVKDKMMM